jgi:hypothetical protein
MGPAAVRKTLAGIFTDMTKTFFYIATSVFMTFQTFGQTTSRPDKNRGSIDTVRQVFEDYIQYSESTDSKSDQAAMTRNLERLQTVKNPSGLETLINVWMYYDPTDFPSIPLIKKILKDSRPESIEAVKLRMKNKRPNESADRAPYSDLSTLLTFLQKD